MFYNLKITIRNLRNNGLYSVINIAGLAVSLAACAFVVLWVQDEKSYDRFHQDADNIHMAVAHFKNEGTSSTSPATSGLFGPVAKQDFPEVESYCRTVQSFAGYLQAGNVKSGRKPIIFADSTFFSFFNFPLVKGAKNGLLQNPEDVIISESLARELFSNEDPIGKTINLEKWANVHVVAVMKDFPRNTSIPEGDIICSFKLMDPAKNPRFEWFVKILDSWEGCEFGTYLRLKPGADIVQLAKDITGKQPGGNESVRSFTLIPLTDMHLYNLDGEPAGIKAVNMFQWIALVILIIACVNYVNLVTARAMKRRREIGLKKTLGAKKIQLFSQLIFEAVILFTIAAFIAVFLNAILLPLYNQLSGKEIHFEWFNLNVWLVYGLMIGMLIILAGIFRLDYWHRLTP